jgi:hypothetical protein
MSLDEFKRGSCVCNLVYVTHAPAQSETTALSSGLKHSMQTPFFMSNHALLAPSPDNGASLCEHCDHKCEVTQSLRYKVKTHQ